MDHEIASISSLRTFCAGGEDVGPCNGDSGWKHFFIETKEFLQNKHFKAAVFILKLNHRGP